MKGYVAGEKIFSLSPITNVAKLPPNFLLNMHIHNFLLNYVAKSYLAI